MSIRPALPADHEFILSLVPRLGAVDLPPWRTPEEVTDAERRALLAILATPPSECAVFVAENGEEREGFIYLHTVTDYFRQQPQTHVSMLAVNQQASGRGVGSALMRAAEEWAASHGHAMVTLNVFEGNRPAREVYQHLGYRPETVRYVKLIRSG